MISLMGFIVTVRSSHGVRVRLRVGVTVRAVDFVNL